MNVKNFLKLWLILTIICLLINPNVEIFNNNNDIIRKKSDDLGKKDNTPINTAQSEWFIPPTLNRKYFSPDTTPGEGDSVLYYFAVEFDDTYEVNISAYYDPIDNYPYSTFSEWIVSSAYLMPNGTWLIAAVRSISDELGEIIFGMGLNTTTFKWKTVGYLNSTEDIAIAGDKSGKIRIVYPEKNGLNRNFTGIVCLYSNDWGETWNRTD
ncbi:MAG: hypothetical protein ACTSVV_03290, partial [Promethearchaeota archaeon]